MDRAAKDQDRLRRGALALICALVLALNLFAMGQARAAKTAVPAPHPAVIVSIAAQPCPPSGPAVCTFAGLSAAMTSEDSAAPFASRARTRAAHYAQRDGAALAAVADDAPFRPPRAG